MAWLCNDQQQKSLFRHCWWCVWALAECVHLPAELLAYKGASQSQSPSAGRCTWLPLGVLATVLWQGTKGNSDTQTTDGLCCLSVMPLWVTQASEQRGAVWRELGQTDPRVKGDAATLIYTLVSIIFITNYLRHIALLLHQLIKWLFIHSAKSHCNRLYV